MIWQLCELYVWLVVPGTSLLGFLFCKQHPSRDGDLCHGKQNNQLGYLRTMPFPEIFLCCYHVWLVWCNYSADCINTALSLDYIIHGLGKRTCGLFPLGSDCLLLKISIRSTCLQYCHWIVASAYLVCIWVQVHTYLYSKHTSRWLLKLCLVLMMLNSSNGHLPWIQFMCCNYTVV